MSVYDDEKEKLSELEQGSTGSSSSGFTRRYSAGRSSTGSSNNTQASDGGATTPTDGGGFFNEKGDTSASSTSATPSQLSAAEKDGWGEGGLYNSTAGTGDKKIAFKNLIRTRARRRALIGGGVATTLVGSSFAFFVFASGPLQFVHFAQLLQQFHMRSNEDFGNDRSSRVLMSALFGGPAERARMGKPGNIAADAWEKRLLKETGLRPVYSQTTRRVVGFEVVDKFKATRALHMASDKDKANLERAMGKGAEMRTAGEASQGRQNIVRGKSSTPLSPNTLIIDIGDMSSYNERAKLIRTVSNLGGTSKISSAVGSRLLIKRAGVDFHPLKNVARKKTDKLADYRQKRREEKAKEDRTGAEAARAAHASSTNDKGEVVAAPEDVSASDETNKVIDEAKNNPGKGKAKELAKGLGKGPAIGLLCAVDSLGDDIARYKYLNNALPMMRMGMSVITSGNQVMSNQDVNMDELGAFNESFHDPETNTTWTQAKSIQAELGQKQTGVDMPPEADLKNVNKKPKLFETLDSNPVVGTTCGAVNAVYGLPIIGSVVSVASGTVSGAINIVAGAFGTSTDEMMGSLLAAASGQSVDTLARGANFGNLANTGAFLGSVDVAMSMGGTALSVADAIALEQTENAIDANINASRSIASRYLDPYDNRSLVSAIIDRTPSSSTQLTSSVGNIASVFSGGVRNLASIFAPRAQAAFGDYNYGIPKFGFSIEERQNTDFENPYENAEIVENSGLLEQLNEKYGKRCFGMTVAATSSGVSIESDSMGSDNLNMFKTIEKAECQAKQKEVDPWFLRYRFYLADSVTALSLACYEGDEVSCSNVGIENSAATGSEAESDSGISGDSQEIAQQILVNENIDLSSSNFCRYCLEDVQNMAEGRPAYGNIEININVLKFLLELAQNTKVDVNSISGEGSGHSANSNHYKGTAVDLGCNGIDGTLLDSVGKKYGIKSNNERCDANYNHWHYSTTGT